MRKRLLEIILLITTAVGVGCTQSEPEAPDESLAESVVEPLTGPVLYDSSCPLEVRPFLDRAVQYGRIASNSAAFQTCIMNLRASSPYFTWPYMPECTPGDPAPSASAAEQAATLLPLTRIENPLTMACDFTDRICGPGATACAFPGNALKPDELLYWSSWLQRTYDDPPEVPNNPWAPTIYASGAIWHESMHQYGYTHPEVCSAPGYNYQRNTVPYIVGQCIYEILQHSSITCGSADSCGPDALPIISTLDINEKSCTCVQDPRIGTVVPDSGFEDQLSSTISAPWLTEGPDNKGIDLAVPGRPYAGKNNAWIHPSNTASTSWNAIKMTVPVRPFTRYVLTAMIRTTSNINSGWFGIRKATSTTVKAQEIFGNLPNYSRVVVRFDSQWDNFMTIFAGYWAPGSDSWMQLDDVKLRPEIPLDGSFELQTSSTISAPWVGEGPGRKGIDRNAGWADTGANNAWINPLECDSHNWNAIKQTVAVAPNTNYTLKARVRNSGNFYLNGHLGVRTGSTTTVLADQNFGPLSGYGDVSLKFNSGQNSKLTVYAGYWAPGVCSWMQLDNVSLLDDP